ncbi:MAG: hypothetical protein EBU66_19925 [Bacteroidetes bacterium]|nr:hypothetical protein [bacterium]NBP66900.1 hypothetical protein [Bacteroidota bacterium]
MDIYNKTTVTPQVIYDAYNTLVFSPDTRVFNKMIKRTEIYMKVKDLLGDILEFGVFKGSGIALFLKLKEMYEPNSHMKVIGFDYFQKESLIDSLDGINKNSMTSILTRVDSSDLSLDSVTMRLSCYNPDNYMLIQGDAAAECKKFCVEYPGSKIKILYMDLDTAEPTYTILKALWSRVVKGGIVVFDEYAFHVWDETLGVDAFLKEIEGQYESFNTFINAPTMYIKKLVI